MLLISPPSIRTEAQIIHSAAGDTRYPSRSACTLENIDDSGCVVGNPEVIQKRAPEELAVTLLVLRWARVGSRVEPLVCGGGFQLSAVPVHRNGGRRFP